MKCNVDLIVFPKEIFKDIYLPISLDWYDSSGFVFSIRSVINEIVSEGLSVVVDVVSRVDISVFSSSAGGVVVIKGSSGITVRDRVVVEGYSDTTVDVGVCC